LKFITKAQIAFYLDYSTESKPKVEEILGLSSEESKGFVDKLIP